MDEIDVANDYAAKFVDMALQAVRAQRPARSSTGICEACHLHIEPERMKANPAATLCHDCAEDAEAHKMRARRTGIGH